jgi:hypothetical protein
MDMSAFYDAIASALVGWFIVRNLSIL